MVALRFDDGSPDVVLATTEEVGDLYEALWLLSAQTRGAISAAAKISHARHVSSPLAQVESLSISEGQAVREALASLR